MMLGYRHGGVKKYENGGPEEGYEGYEKKTGKNGKVYYVSKTDPKMNQLDADGNPVSPMEQFTRPGSAIQSIKDIVTGNPHIYDVANLTFGTLGRGVRRLTQLGQKLGYEATDSDKKTFNLRKGGLRMYKNGGNSTNPPAYPTIANAAQAPTIDYNASPEMNKMIGEQVHLHLVMHIYHSMLQNQRILIKIIK